MSPVSKVFILCAMKRRALETAVSKNLDRSSLTNVALGWVGVALAGSSAAFAIRMIASQHDPLIRDMQYLAIFAQPNSAALRRAQPSSAVVITEARPSPGVDYTATASIQKPGSVGPSRPLKEEKPGYEILGANQETAWLRIGVNILEVRKGQSVPGIGEILAIERRGDAWRLVVDDGRTAREDPRSSAFRRNAGTMGRSEKKLILGDEKR